MPRTYQPVRSLDKCSDTIACPASPHPGFARGRPASPASPPHCHTVLFDHRTKHPPKSDRVQYGAVDLWSAATTTQQSNTPKTSDLAYVGQCSVNPGDFGAVLKLHGSFGVIVMHLRNGRAFRK